MASADRIGICLTGLQRALLEMPVATTYQQHVREPLERHFRVDSLLAVVVPPDRNGSHARLTAAVQEIYKPQALELVPLADTAVL